jgi:hypothetical protein
MTKVIALYPCRFCGVTVRAGYDYNGPSLSQDCDCAQGNQLWLHIIEAIKIIDPKMLNTDNYWQYRDFVECFKKLWQARNEKHNPFRNNE